MEGARQMRWFALSLVSAIVLGAAATAATARTTIISLTTGDTPPLATAIDDPIYQTSQGPTAYAMSSAAGATYARLLVSWRQIAPATQPSSWDPTNPSSPYYHWSSLNASVSA